VDDLKSNSELVNAKKTYEEKSQLEQLELNKKKYQQRQLLGENGYNLKIQIEKAKQNLSVSGINHSFLLLEAFNQMSNLKKETMN
jgi:hypothetical protein